MISSHDKEIQALVNDIREGRLLLPELQRGYVWKSTQVRDLFDSLYHEYPSGQLLIWETDDLPGVRTPNIEGLEKGARRPQLLLDGQQRLTSLAAVMLGRALKVRDSKRPIEIVFNVYSEKFEVAGPRQSRDAGWISLSTLFAEGEFAAMRKLNIDFTSAEADLIHKRLTRVTRIRNYSYRVNLLEDLSYDEVTDIFVRINSGGTTLNSADLTLAQISTRWRGVTKELDDLRQALKQRGLEADNGLLLRTLAVFLNAPSSLNFLFRGERQNLTVEQFEAAWKRVCKAMLEAVTFVINNCHIDRLDLLPTQYILIPLAVFFDQATSVTAEQTRHLQRWVYLALIWSRYSGASETAIDQDVVALTRHRSVQAMIQNIEDQVGRNRIVTERELRDQRRNSPYMVMAYVLARRAHAQDWFKGVVIGGSRALELHHIFPKKLLRGRYDLRRDSRIVDQVANLVFVSEQANRTIAAQPPEVYLPQIDEPRLRAQCVPLSRELWQLHRFEDFVLERRKLLADQINLFLARLAGNDTMTVVSDDDMLETRIDDLERKIRELIAKRLDESYGDQAWQHSIPSKIRNTVERLIERRIENKPFEANQYDRLVDRLSFCLFSDYLPIIEANWNLFSDLFGNLENLQRHFRAATTARNALKHHNSMNRTDRALAEGGLSWLEDCIRPSLSIISEQELDQNSAEEEDDWLTEEENEAKREFLAQCSPHAARLFSTMAEEALTRRFAVRWNRKSISIRDPLAQLPTAPHFGYAYIPSEEVVFYLKELQLTPEQDAALRQELLQSGFFRIAGQWSICSHPVTAETVEPLLAIFLGVLDHIAGWIRPSTL